MERIEARFSGAGFEPHRHDTYALGLTLAGVQTFHYRGSLRASLPGQIIVLHPDELHDGAAGSDSALTYRMLYLPPERLAEAANARYGLPFVKTPVVSDEDFRLRLSEALDDLDSELPALQMDDLIAGLADSLWRHADDRRSPKAGHAEGPVARQAMLRCRDYLAANRTRTVSSAELEAVSGLDRYAVARHFRRLMGTSPHRYLVMRRLDHAKSLMSSGRLGLAEVAMTAGFADQAHFSRHFKKAFGMPPGRWLALKKGA